MFDKDYFEDFNQAIQKGLDKELDKGYNVAWSNQAFEYWLYLHFEYSDSALHRDEWNNKLNKIFKECGLGKGIYQKNNQDIYQMVNCNDGVNTAIKNVKRRMAGFNGKQKPSEYDPGTVVYKLAEELKSYLDE